MNERKSSEVVRWLETQRDLSLLMAHDLRNPLAAVLANLNFLELAARPDDGDMLEAVADIKLSTEMLLRLIENYVAIARLEASPTLSADETQPLPVGEAVRQAFDRASPAGRAAGVDLTLEVRAPEAQIKGDPALLELLVENLVGNVSQHVRRGQRARVTVDADPTHVTIALDDDGAAFGTVDRDFTREGQLEMKKRSDARYSRGLALYVLGLGVHAMGGTIDTASSDGKGHVRIVWPRFV